MKNTGFLEFAENAAAVAKVELDTEKFNRFAEIDAEAWLEMHSAEGWPTGALELRTIDDEWGGAPGPRAIRPLGLLREAVEK